jgi:hypothetical protein
MHRVSIRLDTTQHRHGLLDADRIGAGDAGATKPTAGRRGAVTTDVAWRTGNVKFDSGVGLALPVGVWTTPYARSWPVHELYWAVHIARLLGVDAPAQATGGTTVLAGRRSKTNTVPPIRF